MEFRSVQTEFKADISQRILEGYASAFGNPDSYGDIVQRGAFTKTILERKNRIKVLNQHNTNQPIGKPLTMLEDSHGLLTTAFIANTPLGSDVLTLAAEGILSELSIGFDTVKSSIREAGGRDLEELRLWEWSPVTFAANDLAIITGVKSSSDLEPIIRNLETLAGAGLKSGRVLSDKNLTRMKNAVIELQAILADSEPSTDTQKTAKHRLEPQTHSVLTGISDIRNQLAAQSLAMELRAASNALRGV